MRSLRVVCPLLESVRTSWLLYTYVNDVEVIVDSQRNNLCNLIALHWSTPLFLKVTHSRFTKPTLSELFSQLFPCYIEEAVARGRVSWVKICLKVRKGSTWVNWFFLVSRVEQSMHNRLFFLCFLAGWAQADIWKKKVSRCLNDWLLNKLKLLGCIRIL
jgi:hypothetical protein